VDVFFCAPVGRDNAGDTVAAALVGEDFARLDLPRLDRPTDMSLVMVLPGGENSIVSAGACAAALDEDAAISFAARAGAGDVLLLQGNLSEAATRAAIGTAVARGARAMLNTAPLWWSPGSMLADCAVVVANQGEAEALSGQHAAAEAADWMRGQGVGLAVVTMGPDGCVTAGSAGTRRWQAVPVAAVDTTGCGDAFCGMLAVMLAADAKLPAAIGAAQRAAAITAGRAGAYVSLPSADELAAFTHIVGN
jgi:ribokinase